MQPSNKEKAPQGTLDPSVKKPDSPLDATDTMRTPFLEPSSFEPSTTPPKPPEDPKATTKPWDLRWDDDDDDEKPPDPQAKTARKPQERHGEGWDAYVPEFLKRSLSFGREHEQHEQKTPNEPHAEGAKGWFIERFSKELRKEMAHLPKEITKEIVRVVLSQADRAKTEALKIIATELRSFLDQIKLWEEMRNLMDGVSIDIEMKVRFHTENPSQTSQPQMTVTSVSTEVTTADGQRSVVSLHPQEEPPAAETNEAPKDKPDHLRSET